MKLTFFLVAFFLILMRVCLPAIGLWHHGPEQGTMVMESDNYHEGIWWSGKYRLSDDDRSVSSISPGGYLKFRENDTTMKLESDLQGRISYTLYNGREHLPLNDSGRNFIAAQLQKMIRLGFFGDQRAERIYRQGGVSALLGELSRIKMEGGREPYLKLLLRTDSLTADQRIALLRLTDSSQDMGERQHLLEEFHRARLDDPAVAREWLTVVGHLDASYMKKNLLLKYIDSSLTVDQFDTVLAITSRFESDADEQDIYKSLVDLPQLRMDDSAYAQPWLSAVGQLEASYQKKDLLLTFIGRDSAGAGLAPRLFDTVVAITGRFGSSADELEVYKRLSRLPGITAEEWADLLQASVTLDADYLKGELLRTIALKMPRTDSLRAGYRSAAKSIQGDDEYGKTMRAIE
ncbi:MAG TPA: hypothetical protein VKU83_03105 [Puia sp.]|nr:hypothetical protein [Puia sp.]